MDAALVVHHGNSSDEGGSPEPAANFYVVAADAETGPYRIEQVIRMWDTGVLTADVQLRSSESEQLQNVAELVAAHRRDRAGFKGAFAVGGIVLGSFLGYFAAHYFPFWGGLAMLGEAHSQARSSLVPGHVGLCALILGGIAFAVAHLRQAKAIAITVVVFGAVAAALIFKNPENFSNPLKTEKAALPTKADFRRKVIPYSPRHGGLQRISPQRLIEITGKPERQQRVEDQVYWHFDCRDGLVQLVLDGDAMMQGWALVTSINEY